MARVSPADELAELAEVLVTLALELRAGVLPDRALVAAAGTTADPVLRRAASAARCAEDPVPALLSSAQPVLRALGAAWRVSATTGAPLAVAVERLALAARSEADALRVLDAALAGPRSSARILAGLPALGLLMGEGMGAHPVSVLLTTAPGWGCLGAGVLAATGGMVWTGRLVARAGRDCAG